MNDHILRATALEGSVRIFAATTKNTVNEAVKIHKTSPVVTASLGRMLTGASIMGAMLKNDKDIITLSIKGNGPIKCITVTSDSKSQVKGYVGENLVNLKLKENGKLDVKKAIGNGTLTVIKDIGLKEPVSSKINLVSGEIAEDITYYFAKSEQIPSAVSLGVLVDKDYTVKQSGGFIIQLMPNAKEETITFLEEKLKNIKPITELFEEKNTPYTIIQNIFKNCDIKIYNKIDVNYYCNCSFKKVEKVLITLGINELKNILKEDKKATIHCHFCNKDYNFEEKDLLNLINKLENKEK